MFYAINFNNKTEIFRIFLFQSFPSCIHLRCFITLKFAMRAVVIVAMVLYIRIADSHTDLTGLLA